MTKLLASLALAAIVVALTPKAALAEKGVPITGSFTVAFTRTLNTSNATYCGAAVLPYATAANGAGYTSGGAFYFSLNKTVANPGIMQGCVTLTASNGDILNATYMGTINGSMGQGTLTFTGGTGRFVGATGSAKFTGIFAAIYPSLTNAGGGTIPYLQGLAFYLVDGTVSLREDQPTGEIH